MKALVLAAGFGTRLEPHTRRLPKALFPVGGIPVLGRMIIGLKKAGCTHIAVNAHHLAGQIQTYLAQNDFGIPLHLSVEPKILGTGGAIRRLAEFWDRAPFLVVNADILTDIDFQQVYHRHCRHDASATLVMHDQGRRSVVPAVAVVHLLKIDVRENVCVDNQEGGPIPKLGQTPDGAAGAQDLRLHAQVQRNSEIVLRQVGLDLTGQVVGIHRDMGTAGLFQPDDHAA